MKILKTLLFLTICTFSNAQNWFPLGEGVGFGYAELFSFEDKLFAGGDFFTIDGLPASGIAYWDKKKWKSFSTDGLPYNSYRSFSVYNDGLYVHGMDFSTNAFGKILKYNKFENTWDSLPNSEIKTFYPQIDQYLSGNVSHSIEFQNELYITGNFDQIGNKELENIAKWNGETWEPVLDNSGEAIKVSNVSALEVFNNELIISGVIESINNQTYLGIAKWDGEFWSNFNSQINAISSSNYSTIRDLEVFQGALYAAGGGVRILGGNQVYPLVKWDGEQWKAINIFDSETIRLSALKSFGNYLAIGGQSPIGSTYLYNGKTVTRIEEESNGYIVNFVEFDKQLFLSTLGDIDIILTNGGIFKLGRIVANKETITTCNFFPNPTDGTFMIGYKALDNSTTIISFYNALGILVHEEIFNDKEGHYLRRLNLEELQTGTYMVNILSKGINETKLIMKN